MRSGLVLLLMCVLFALSAGCEADDSAADGVEQLDLAEHDEGCGCP